MYYGHNMSTGQAQPPQTVTSSAMPYPSHQPSLLASGPQYPSQAQYGQYGGYQNGLTSPPTAPPVSNPMGGSNVLPLPGVASQTPMPQYASFDTTGQQPPPGMKPRVTATLWEDEGSLCFQVEARGICVARREDNHMINGTKLLNVAGMTRGRRDGILKSEKIRHVVKIGPMHLKGVWIPYERALDFANKEKITELLYPLFVHNIGALLYHPTNQNRTNQVMAAAERRKQDPAPMRNPAPQGLPSLSQHHHQPMGLPNSQPPLPSHSMARPSIDRAHTFPTPPTSASGVMPNMGNSDNFHWQGQNLNGAQGNSQMTIDTGLSNARSMPNTPATTPPGSSLQSMQPYPSATQAYDGPRQMYNAPPAQQSPYQPTNGAPQDRMYGQQAAYTKNEMGPPSNRPTTAAPPGDHQSDHKAPNGIMSSEQQSHGHGGEEEHEHETEYTHDSGAYDTGRASYNYTAPGVGALANEANMAPEMNGSPNHAPASGRATPRSAAPPQPYYSQHTGYNTPPRVQQTSSSLYSVMSNDRAPGNGAPGGDGYAPTPDMGNSMANGYSNQGQVVNGASNVLKRGREEDDDLSRGANDGPGSMGNLDLKRRKTLIDASMPSAGYDAMSRSAPPVAAARRR
ncbi:hypothetical protein B0I35DRAFT_405305 [Stachybotrys elegans]|uniref:HTH APSES-type domain-containing protein n=1 Tax=Stachybotrys elegans TaxID=80388 RepID=A0A8K0SYB9_9HYPO|nr:hypothetical protein B0I35DRAFT_405305 [Stachybotrys elegans]